MDFASGVEEDPATTAAAIAVVAATDTDQCFDNGGTGRFGGFAIRGIAALLGEAAVTALGHMGNTTQGTDKDGSTIEVNFAFVLAHEIEHQMGRDHITLPNGEESDYLTPNVAHCSGVN